jgi:hypothetical protein
MASEMQVKSGEDVNNYNGVAIKNRRLQKQKRLSYGATFLACIKQVKPMFEFRILSYSLAGQNASKLRKRYAHFK